jgi:bacterioferritin
MKDKDNIVPVLNGILSNKLTSISQFFLHSRIFKNWGLAELNEKAYEKSIKDMKQADKLIERILFLEGLPNLQHLEKLRIGQHPEEMLSSDYQFELDHLPPLKEAIAKCETAKDFVSRDLVVAILDTEEAHIDWLETQQYLIKSTGIENYLQSQLSD